MGPREQITFEPVEIGEGEYRHVREMKGSNGFLYRPVPAFLAATKTISTSSEGIVEAFVSVTDIEDDVQDIILPGAYLDTLKARNPKGVWCADAETEILTDRGWARYDELTTADHAYVLDVESLTARFEQVEAVNVFPAETREVRRVETGGFSSLTTLDHRWPVRTARGRIKWKTTRELGVGDGIIRSLPNSEAPEDPKWSDAFVEVVAWAWNEGCFSKTGTTRLSISQSETANPLNCAAIRSALDRAFPGSWWEQGSGAGKSREFRLQKEATESVAAVCGTDKAPTPEFLLSLTLGQLRLFIATCLEGDGTVETSGTERWSQRSTHSLGMFEMACALAGIPTNRRSKKSGRGHHGRPVSIVTLLKRRVARPFSAAWMSTKYKPAHQKRVESTDEVGTHDGIVWCPTTPSGTWLARRRGTVYFTGNSHDWDTWTAKTLRAQEYLPNDTGLPTEVKQLGGGALLIVGQFNLKTQAGHDAFANVEFFGDDCEWSVGYQVPAGQATYDQKSGIRRIKRMDLYEWSPVLFGAMPLTSTLSVKTRLADPTAAAIARQERIRLNLKADKPDDGHAHDHTHPADGDAGALTHSHDHDHEAPSTYDHSSDAEVAHTHDRGMGANDDDAAGGDRSGTGSDAKRLTVKQATQCYLELKKDYSTETRQEMAKKDQALADGSWPIGDSGDLTDAIDTLARTSGKGTAEYGEIKRRVIKSARQLDMADKLPGEWDMAKAMALEGILSVKGGPAGLIDWYNAGADGQIDWGSAGDFDACVAVATQHMDPDQAKGFCNLRHQDAVGGPPGSEGKTVRLRDGSRWVVGEKITAARRAELKADPPAGSFEERQSALWSAVRDWAEDTFDDWDPDTDYAYIETTFADRVVICVTMDGEDHYFEVPYTLEDPDNDGDVDGVSLGDPTEVDVQTVITPEGEAVVANRPIPAKSIKAVTDLRAHLIADKPTGHGAHDVDLEGADGDQLDLEHQAAHVEPGFDDHAHSKAHGMRNYWQKDVDPSDAGLASGAGVHTLTSDDIAEISATVRCPNCAKTFGVSSDELPVGSKPMLDHAVMDADGNASCPYCNQTVALAPGAGTVKSAKLLAALKYAGTTVDASGSGVVAPSGGRTGSSTDATPDYAGTTGEGGRMSDPGKAGPLGIDPDDPDHVVIGVRMITPNVGLHLVDDDNQTHSLAIRSSAGDQLAEDMAATGAPGAGAKARKDVAGGELTKGSSTTPSLDDAGAHLHIEIRTLSPGVTLHVKDSLGEVHDLPIGYASGDQLAQNWLGKAMEILGVSLDAEGRYVKAGRVLSGSNATAIKEAVQRLVSVLERAGIDLSDGDGDETKLVLGQDDRAFLEHLNQLAELGISRSEG